MKKYLIAVMMTVLILVGVSTTYAADIQTPSENEIVTLFPNAAKVDGVAVYLFGAKTVGIGPSYTVAKFVDLVNADVQFATTSEGGSFFGLGASVTIVDIMKKVGKTTPDMLITFNPSIGITGGYRSSTPNTGAGWDGGIRANILNVDMAKVAGWLGL